MTQDSFTITADQRAKMLRHLNNPKAHFDSRAGRLMRDFNSVLRFSPSAQALYFNLSGFMGVDKNRARDECRVKIEVMARWLNLESRAVQNCIRELTLTGALPLIEKREPGRLGRPTLYAFVCDPFALAERQQAEASAAKAGKRNIALRPPIRVVGTATDQRETTLGCLTGEQVDFVAGFDSYKLPEHDDTTLTSEFLALRSHVEQCRHCSDRVALVNPFASALDLCA